MAPSSPFRPNRRPWDPARHCPGHLTTVPCVIDPPKDCPDTSHRCTRPAGAMTDHVGAGYCKWHGGMTPLKREQGYRLLRFREILDSLTGLTLSQIGDRLARIAAANAIVDQEDSEKYLRGVSAYARASERAEGSKVTVDARLGVLADASDEEVQSAIRFVEEEIERRRTAPG